MFLRCKVRRKDGNHHRYWSVVENTRVANGRVVQRHVLYLGEINDTHELRGGDRLKFWRKARRSRGRCRCFRKTAAPERWRTPRSSTSSCRSCSYVGRANGAHVGSPWAMARTAARPVLVEAVGVEPQGDALGSGAVRTGYLSFARACGNGKLPRARILFPALGNLPDAIGNISS